jgi:hypothetical protein
VAEQLGVPALEPTEPVPDGKIVLSTDERSALKRLLSRATATGVDPLQLLTNPNADTVETMFTQSFASGISMDLKDTTVQDQVCGFSNQSSLLRLLSC